MNTITENIYNDITELSDLNLQRKLWLNQGNDIGLISSYIEVMNRLFDDNNFDDFVERTSFDIGLSNNTIFELNKLRELLNNYKEKDTDEEVINDTEWEKIVIQAQTVIKKWTKIK